MGDKTKAEAMDDLFARAVEKSRGICRPGVCLVWGEGSLDAPIAFVGEAPGEQETRLRRPFVGQAGKLFAAEMETTCIDRSQSSNQLPRWRVMAKSSPNADGSSEIPCRLASMA